MVKSFIAPVEIQWIFFENAKVWRKEIFWTVLTNTFCIAINIQAKFWFGHSPYDSRRRMTSPLQLLNLTKDGQLQQHGQGCHRHRLPLLPGLPPLPLPQVSNLFFAIAYVEFRFRTFRFMTRARAKKERAEKLLFVAVSLCVLFFTVMRFYMIK